MIYTIQSVDDVIVKEHLKKIYKQNDIQVDLMNTSEFDCRTVEIEQVLDYCFTAPFFSENKVAILKNPIFLTGENVREDYTIFIEKLMNYIENENEKTLLVIYANYEKLDERKKIVKFLKEKTNFKKLESPNAGQLTGIVKKMIEKRNSSIDLKTVEYLIDRVGNSLVDLGSEIDKLTLFKSNNTITIEDIEEFVAYSSDASIFDLSNAILTRNTSKAMSLFEELSREGFEPIALISILSNQLRLALLAKTYQREGLNNASIAKKLGVHSYRIKLALQLTFSDKNLKETLLKLANLDYQIKIGKINKYHGMKLFILSV